MVVCHVVKVLCYRPYISRKGRIRGQFTIIFIHT